MIVQADDAYCELVVVFLDLTYNPNFPVKKSKLTVFLLNQKDFNRSIEASFPSRLPNVVGDEVLWGF